MQLGGAKKFHHLHSWRFLCPDYIKLWATQSFLALSGAWTRDLLWSLPAWVILWSYDLHLSSPIQNVMVSLHKLKTLHRTDCELLRPKHPVSHWQRRSSGAGRSQFDSDRQSAELRHCISQDNTAKPSLAITQLGRSVVSRLPPWFCSDTMCLACKFVFIERMILWKKIFILSS